MNPPLPAGFEFVRDEPYGPPVPVRRLVGTVVDPGRRKPVPRTLQQAFPLSEGYREWCYMTPAPKSLTERISWAVVIGLALWLVVWAAQNRPHL